MLPRFVLAAVVTSALALAGVATALTVVTPSSGSYLGRDHLDTKVTFSLKSGHVIDFKWGATKIFSSAKLNGLKFTFKNQTYKVNGHWTSDHYVEGSIFKGDQGYTFDAHEFAF